MRRETWQKDRAGKPVNAGVEAAVNLPPELHPYAGAAWEKIYAQVTEADELERKELLAALQEALGRPDLRELELAEVIWLAVGSSRHPIPNRYSEIPRRGIEALEKLQLTHDQVQKLHALLETWALLNS